MNTVKKVLANVISVVVILSVVVTMYYIDYKIYKAKYPNTTMWMWLVDNKK